MGEAPLPGREAAVPNPALAGWSPFMGEWETIGSHPYMPGVILHGRTSFDWLEGGAFVIMRSEIDEPRIPSGIAIFGTDDATGEAVMLYFDERLVSRRYDFELTAQRLVWWRNAPGFAQRFVLTLSGDRQEMKGKGEMSRNDAEWEPDLELTYRRVAERVG
jgi:hypothetical protein